jgi:transcriptional regulator with XRE-family HTH domain
MVLNIGDLIKNKRLEDKLTQSQLAEGICARETISQLESNKTLPRLFIIEQVLGKLSIDGDTLLALPGSEKDIYSIKKQAEIYGYMYNAEKFPKEGGRDLKEALEALENDKYIHKNYKFFLLKFGYTHLYIYSESEQNLELAEESAFTLLRKYRPNFDLKQIKIYYLTSTELNLINRLSYLYRLKNEPQTSIKMLEKSKSFQEEKHLDRDLRGLRPIYISTIMHLADNFLLSNNFEEALKLVNKYYLRIKEHDSLKLVMKFLYVQCIALLNLGRDKEGKEIFEKICLLHNTVDNLFIQLDPTRPDVREWMAYVKEVYGI